MNDDDEGEGFSVSKLKIVRVWRYGFVPALAQKVFSFKFYNRRSDKVPVGIEDFFIIEDCKNYR